MMEYLSHKKNTGRKEHLAANQKFYKPLLLFSIACPLGVAVGSYHLWNEAAFVPEMLIVPFGYCINEIWNTPDNDLAWKLKWSFRKAYWLLWSKLVRHRGILTHTFPLGTTVRFCIAYWIPILAFVIGWNWEVIQAGDDWVAALTFPERAGWIIVFAWIGCGISDLVHYCTDRMSFIKMFVTGDA
jgi:uncharacterized metal-binding protein